MTHVLELPPAFRAAELRAASFSATDNSVEVVWTTGATVRRMSWMDGPYDEELVVSANAVRLGRLNGGAPFLDSHSGESLGAIKGIVMPGSARLEAGQGLARVQLSSAPGDADAVQKIRDGIIRNISVGYVRHGIEKTERDNGAVPLWRVIDWEPMELSAVAIPADAGAHFRSAGGGNKPPAFPCTFRGASAAEIARLRLQMSRRRAAA